MSDPLAQKTQFLAAAQAAADVAACIVRPFFRVGVRADDKADASPVTIADRSAERAIRAVIGERLPHHGIMGEEFGTEQPDAAYRWVIDPVDGTRAFLTGRPTFGTLIALLHDGVPVLGIIDQPITGERWIGVRGEATRYVSRLAGQAGTRLCPSLAQAELSCTAPEILEGDYRPRWEALSRAVKRVSWGGGLLRIWPAGVGTGGYYCRMHHETMGLGRPCPCGRRCGRSHDGLGRAPAPA